MLYLASKSSTSLIQSKFDPMGCFSRSASQSRLFYFRFNRIKNVKNRGPYPPRRIPRNIELKPTAIHLRYCSTPPPFWLIGILHHQYILSCVGSWVRQGIRHRMRHTLVGADSVIKTLSVLVASDLYAGLIEIRNTIHRAIGKPLRDVTDISKSKRWETNLVEEPFAVVCPSDGRNSHKS
jgi:hypothetical protein